MSTWEELSLETASVAKSLLSKKEQYRACMSRAYYAAFYAATSVLSRVKNVNFDYGRNNPSHRQLAGLLRDNLPFLPEWKRRELVSAVRRLFKERIDADYRRFARIDRQVALNAIRDSGRVLRILGLLK